MRIEPLAPALCTCVVIFSAPGCGDADKARPAQTNITAAGPTAARSAAKGWDCTALLSTEDVERIVGRGGVKLVSKVRGDANQESPGHTECGYELPPAGGMHFFINTGPALGPYSGYDLKGAAERNKAERLAGVGDEAWQWGEAKGNSANAFAVAKGAEVFVGVGNEGSKGKLIAQRALEIVVSKL